MRPRSTNACERSRSLIAEGDRDSVELADQMVRLMTHQIDRVEAETRTEGVRIEFEKRVAGCA